MTGYIGNEQKWKILIEIDWLGQYAKAWVAFNAWYRNVFVSNDYDRKIIEKIKSDEGNICSKIEQLLEGDGLEKKLFQFEVAGLHKALSDTTIKSNKKKVSFEKIEDYKHAKQITETKHTIIYEIKIKADSKERKIEVKKSDGTSIFTKTIIIKDDESSDQMDFKGLSKAQINALKGFIQESSPIHNLVAHRPDETIDIGDFKFINNTNLIARAIIEILYKLRNSLFHGEITPSKEVIKVYQHAYLILKKIIPGE